MTSGGLPDRNATQQQQQQQQQLQFEEFSELEAPETESRALQPSQKGQGRGTGALGEGWRC
eukprot:8494085-Alexandrium_andersonii.AAC.1